MSRRDERKRGTARLIRLREDDGAFDREFWATVPPPTRLELVWDMALEYLSWRGLDGDQSRLQRSICRIEHPDLIFQIGVAPNRVDVMTSIDGVRFSEAWEAREITRYGDQQVPVISRAHLIQNKRASGRPQDLIDLEILESAQG